MQHVPTGETKRPRADRGNKKVVGTRASAGRVGTPSERGTGSGRFHDLECCAAASQGLSQSKHIIGS